MKHFYNTKISKTEIEAIVQMIDDIESMIGCASPLEEGGKDWDDYMRKRIKTIRRFFKRNGIDII